jgi:hypothetical protein
MKTFFAILFAGVICAWADPVDTASNVVHSTVRGTKKAAKTVAHGAKRVAEKVEDVFTPESDARRVDVTVSENGIDMPNELKPGKTAFVVKNAGNKAQNFELSGPDVDRTFASAPAPGQTKVLHATLERGTYTVYSTPAKEKKEAATVTVKVK